ncbi:Phosphoserine aminotransferase [Perkinsus olseni]|uniref:phosphoserine transaminase n=1 Tax=Perkinsus olseni TaxID=32597 RepID=A0A7J6M9H5_PEROL|nr:Phosphoserine aminotransferase [Perkinsus olseni]KAF4673733.1 Phosphoserine aminotransferase [Perkinsus olseni]
MSRRFLLSPSRLALDKAVSGAPLSVLARAASNIAASLRTRADFNGDSFREKVAQVHIQTAPKYHDKRVFNFSAGPAALPDEVMYEAQRDFSNYAGTGMGVMELSHRDVEGPFQTVLAQAEDRLREMLHIPANYKVMFLQGGAHAQFSGIPLNLFRPELGHKVVEYIDTGYWGQRSLGECARMIGGDKIKVINKEFNASLPANVRGLPGYSDLDLTTPASEVSFTHFTANETMEGLEYLDDSMAAALKESGRDVVIDMTSTLLSRPINVENYGVIYASGGKNLGPAGVCLAIVREDLIRPSSPPYVCPSFIDFHIQSTSTPLCSLYNTPPTFAIYMVNLVLGYYQKAYGQSDTLANVQKKAIRRAAQVWGTVDRSNGFYTSPVRPADRSRMSVCLRARGEDRSLEDRFVAEAEDAGLFQLQGNKITGGLRVTLYNGVKDEAVNAACKFMEDFARRYH